MSTAQNQQPVLLINEAVRLEREANVGWVVLTRPQQINAINDDIRRGVPQALALLQQDPEIRVIVIRGEGERGFCAVLMQGTPRTRRPGRRAPVDRS